MLNSQESRMSRSRPWAAGLRHGLIVWWTYAVLEYLLSTVVPLLRSDSMVSPWHTRVSAAIFLAYLAAGLLFGALAGVIAGLIDGPADVRRRRAEIGAAVSLVLCYLVNLQAASPPWYATVFYGVLTAGLLGALRLGRLSFLRGPWVVNLLFLGSYWLSYDLMAGQSRLVRAITLPGLAALVICFAAWQREASGKRSTLASLGAASLAVIAVMTFFGDRSPVRAVTSPGPGGRPNVVLIVLDTVRADHMSVYGYQRRTTPNLEEFAHDATIYRNAVATSDVTLSAHASLFTGLYASSHGAHYGKEATWEGLPLDTRAETLAETLARSGYATASIVANYGYLGPRFGLLQGFAQSDTRVPVLLIAAAKRYYLRAGLRRLLARFVPTREYDRQTRMGEEITRDAFRFLESFRVGKGPFFLFLNYMDAHTPYLPPAPFDTMFPGMEPMFTHPMFNEMSAEVMREKRPIRDVERNHIVSQYDGAIAYVDKQVGDIVRRLKELNLYGSTLVVITADHGEALGDRFLLEHGGVSVYQDQVHIPLLVKYPSGGNPVEVEETVSQVDIMPTSLAVLGLKDPAGVQGTDLRHVELLRDRRVYAECFPSKLLYPLHPKFSREARAVYSRGLKLIQSSNGEREMYSLADDPQEKRDIFRAEDELASSLDKGLSAWLKAARTAQQGASRARGVLDKETLNRLRSLGYVQ